MAPGASLAPANRCTCAVHTQAAGYQWKPARWGGSLKLHRLKSWGGAAGRGGDQTWSSGRRQSRELLCSAEQLLLLLLLQDHHRSSTPVLTWDNSRKSKFSSLLVIQFVIVWTLCVGSVALRTLCPFHRSNTSYVVCLHFCEMFIQMKKNIHLNPLFRLRWNVKIVPLCWIS